MSPDALVGLGLVVGHMLGDYCLQNDWMAANKQKAARPGASACTAHCLLYTLCVWACSFWWMPWWGLLSCFAAHWPVDRYGLPRKWMVRSGQEGFATGAMAPWSVVAVDNTWHLLTLFLIALAAVHL